MLQVHATSCKKKEKEVYGTQQTSGIRIALTEDNPIVWLIEIIPAYEPHHTL